MSYTGSTGSPPCAMLMRDHSNHWGQRSHVNLLREAIQVRYRKIVAQNRPGDIYCCVLTVSVHASIDY